MKTFSTLSLRCCACVSLAVIERAHTVVASQTTPPHTRSLPRWCRLDTEVAIHERLLNDRLLRTVADVRGLRESMR